MPNKPTVDDWTGTLTQPTPKELEAIKKELFPFVQMTIRETVKGLDACLESCKPNNLACTIEAETGKDELEFFVGLARGKANERTFITDSKFMGPIIGDIIGEGESIRLMNLIDPKNRELLAAYIVKKSRDDWKRILSDQNHVSPIWQRSLRMIDIGREELQRAYCRIYEAHPADFASE